MRKRSSLIFSLSLSAPGSLFQLCIPAPIYYLSQEWTECNAEKVSAVHIVHLSAEKQPCHLPQLFSRKYICCVGENPRERGLNAPFLLPVLLFRPDYYWHKKSLGEDKWGENSSHKKPGNGFHFSPLSTLSLQHRESIHHGNSHEMRFIFEVKLNLLAVNLRRVIHNSVATHGTQIRIRRRLRESEYREGESLERDNRVCLP